MVNEIRRLFNSNRAKLQKSALCVIGTLIAKRGRGGKVVRRQGTGMKKGIISIVLLVVLAVTAIPAGAQTRYRRYDGRRYEQRYDSRRTNGNWDDDRSVWDRHRDKITTAAGAGAGALIGAVVGGKKGAIIGAIAGGGGAAIYTYGIRDDDDRYRYSRRRRY